MYNIRSQKWIIIVFCFDAHQRGMLKNVLIIKQADRIVQLFFTVDVQFYFTFFFV